MSKRPAHTNAWTDTGAADQVPAQRSVPATESGPLAARLKAIIGGESVSSFARRCGIAESVLRTYLRDGRMPPLDKAAALAAAAGVSVDWLATGCGMRAVAQASPAYAVSGPAPAFVPGAPALDAAVLEGVVKAVLQGQGGQASPEQAAAMILDLYERSIDRRQP